MITFDKSARENFKILKRQIDNERYSNYDDEREIENIIRSHLFDIKSSYESKENSWILKDTYIPTKLKEKSIEDLKKIIDQLLHKLIPQINEISLYEIKVEEELLYLASPPPKNSRDQFSIMYSIKMVFKD